MSEALRTLGEYIASRRPDHVTGWRISNGDLIVETPPSSLRGLVDFLRADMSCQFTQLVDITAIDYPDRDKRFVVVYHFLSMKQNQRICLQAGARLDEMVPSLTDIFPAANWYEREVFDMFGVVFSGHPVLRRILTVYGFRGHPLRMVFPTSGYVELRYDDLRKTVVYEPVKLVHEYRQYDYLSPWEGAKYILPGDEKAGEGK